MKVYVVYERESNVGYYDRIANLLKVTASEKEAQKYCEKYKNCSDVSLICRYQEFEIEDINE